MNENIKFYGTFVTIIFIIIGWAIFFYFVPPDVLVSKIGIQNSYLVAFVLAVICGFSSITGSTFYVAIAALAHGGADPLILGVVGGLGLCISDFAFYFVVTKGTHVIDKHWQKLSNFIKRSVKIMPEWAVSVFVFLYSAFAPIPNDVVLVALAVAGVSFKKIAPYLFIGDLVSTLLLAYISQ